MNKMEKIFYGLFLGLMLSVVASAVAIGLVLSVKQLLTEPQTCVTLVTVTSYYDVTLVTSRLLSN